MSDVNRDRNMLDEALMASGRAHEREAAIKNPQVSLLSKLASIAVHADEMLAADENELDRAALLSLLGDPEVKAWIAKMTEAALAPRKRK